MRKGKEENEKKTNIINKSLNCLEQSNISKGERVTSNPSLSFIILLQNVDIGNQLSGESLSDVGIDLLLASIRAKHQTNNLFFEGEREVSGERRT